MKRFPGALLRVHSHETLEEAFVILLGRTGYIGKKNLYEEYGILKDARQLQMLPNIWDYYNWYYYSYFWWSTINPRLFSVWPKHLIN